MNYMILLKVWINFGKRLGNTNQTRPADSLPAPANRPAEP